MTNLALKIDYSESQGLGMELKSEDTLTIGLGNGLENIDIKLNDKQAATLLNMLINEVYGEKTLEQAEDKILELESQLEDANNLIEQYQEHFDRRA